ncbi:hypothetical protein CCR75_007393 [Bremia lactucae]|uniref:Uncharacterized protein n=1 Tax=Bremia lactucae TaxID=4779 RepID=A0A976IKA1_BRELC|nr:hypothetical protein CCR75_007393 [Bremia lactucae]
MEYGRACGDRGEVLEEVQDGVSVLKFGRPLSAASSQLVKSNISCGLQRANTALHEKKTPIRTVMIACLFASLNST